MFDANYINYFTFHSFEAYFLMFMGITASQILYNAIYSSELTLNICLACYDRSIQIILHSMQSPNRLEYAVAHVSLGIGPLTYV